jgi:hypothetical protein
MWETKLIKRRNRDGVATSYSITLPIIAVREIGLVNDDKIIVKWKEGNNDIIVSKKDNSTL